MDKVSIKEDLNSAVRHIGKKIEFCELEVLHSISSVAERALMVLELCNRFYLNPFTDVDNYLRFM